MELLLQDVSEGRDAVVQGRRIHREHGVDQDRAPGPADLDIQARVAERGVDEVGGKRGIHEAFFWAMATLRCRPSWVARRTALRRNAAWNSAAVCRARASRLGFKVSGVARNAGSAVGVAWGFEGQTSRQSSQPKIPFPSARWSSFGGCPFCSIVRVDR